MQFYCGMDLGARKTHLCLINQQDHRLIDRKMNNDLFEIESTLSPYKPSLEIVVESTINWEWLVYGLQKKDYEVTLAHTLELKAITWSKKKTDKWDTFTLARLLLYPHPFIRAKETMGLERIELLTGQINSLEKKLFERAKKDYTFSLLQTIPGIGEVLALTIQSPNSKQGNHYLKWAFSQAAIMAIRYYPEIRRLYDRLSSKRKKAAGLVSRSIISHKLARGRLPCDETAMPIQGEDALSIPLSPLNLCL